MPKIVPTCMEDDIGTHTELCVRSNIFSITWTQKKKIKSELHIKIILHTFVNIAETNRTIFTNCIVGRLRNYGSFGWGDVRGLI